MSILLERFSPEMSLQSRSNLPLCGMATLSSVSPLVNQRGEKVLEGTAEVAQLTTLYAFAGRGSQKQGMGMDLYKSFLAVRAVWDSVDAHLISAYGFSIVEIVRENPKKKTIHFGGIKGQAIRER